MIDFRLNDIIFDWIHMRSLWRPIQAWKICHVGICIGVSIKGSFCYSNKKKIICCLFSFNSARYEQCSTSIHRLCEFIRELENSNTPTAALQKINDFLLFACLFSWFFGFLLLLVGCVCVSSYKSSLTSSQCICMVVPFDSI